MAGYFLGLKASSCSLRGSRRGSRSFQGFGCTESFCYNQNGMFNQKPCKMVLSTEGQTWAQNSKLESESNPPSQPPNTHTTPRILSMFLSLAFSDLTCNSCSLILYDSYIFRQWGFWGYSESRIPRAICLLTSGFMVKIWC